MSTTPDLGPIDSLVYLSSYREYEPEADLSYGDLYPCKRPDGHEHVFVLPAYLSGSDYSGGAVEVSNHRVLLEQFGELDGVHEVHGGHGSYAVAIRLDVWQAGTDRDECAWYGADPDAATCDREDRPCAHQMREFLDGLEDYPVADEDDLCRVEFEAQDEAWEYWAEADFVAAICKRFPDDIDDIDITDSDRFRDWFEELRERANVYWATETGNAAHVDIDRVAAELETVGVVLKADAGITVELLRRVGYLSYCQTCGLLISDEPSDTRVEALNRVDGRNGSPSHQSHSRIALERIVYPQT